MARKLESWGLANGSSLCASFQTKESCCRALNKSVAKDALISRHYASPAHLITTHLTGFVVDICLFVFAYKHLPGGTRSSVVVTMRPSSHLCVLDILVCVCVCEWRCHFLYACQLRILFTSLDLFHFISLRVALFYLPRHRF